MTNKDIKTGPGTPEGGDPLSATGMFIRAFESKPEGDEKPTQPAWRPGTGTSADNHGQAASTSGSGVGSSASGNVPPGGPGGGPGEFTQFFQSLNAKPGVAPQGTKGQDTAASAGATAVLKGPGQTPPGPTYRGAQAPPRGEAAPGEFTRIFVSEPISPTGGQGRSGDEAGRTFPPAGGAGPVSSGPVPGAPAAPSAAGAAGGAKAKGFSSPGLSDSASAEGSFTQFFKASSGPPSGSASGPTPPRPAPAAPATPSAAGGVWGREGEWNREPDFRATEKPKEDPSLSVTSLINSLAAQGGTTPRAPEPAPYRPDPLPFASSPVRPAEPAGAEAGGVTRLIQRLAQEQASAPVAPLPTPQPAAPETSGPGEFTRMISGLSGALPPRPQAPASSGPVGASAFAPPAAPPMPKPPAPAHPAVPKVAVPPAPAFAMPPAVAKPAPPPAPALTAPKGKLEAMVPVLLVINTFLLLVILVVMIFLIKAK